MHRREMLKVLAHPTVTPPRVRTFQAIAGRRKQEWGDMKIRVYLNCSASALLFSTVVAHAQLTIDVAKITCQQFLIGRMLPTKSMALWFGGYFNGKRGVTVIEASAVKANGKKLEEYCGMHQDETVVKAAEALFGIK